MSGAGGGESGVPVFVFPAALTFYLHDPSTHKQLLTLYNPYDFPLSYQVLSTAPRKFSVVEPEGVLKPRCCIDLVIRHLAVNRSNVGVGDKFRIQITEHKQREVLGKKDIPAQLLGSVGPSDQSPSLHDTSAASSFHGASDRERGSQPSPQPYSFPSNRHGTTPFPFTTGKPSTESQASRAPSALVIVAGLLCVAALSMPTQGEANGMGFPVPSYLHMTLPQKLVAAYVLGLITMVVFRQ